MVKKFFLFHEKKIFSHKIIIDCITKKEKMSILNLQ